MTPAALHRLARGKATTAEGRHHGPKPVVSVVYGNEYVDGGPF